MSTNRRGFLSTLGLTAITGSTLSGLALAKSSTTPADASTPDASTPEVVDWESRYHQEVTIRKYIEKGDHRFLCRLELKSKGRLIDEGIIEPGHYAVVKPPYLFYGYPDAYDLGNSIDIIPLARRPKAINMSNRRDMVVTYDYRDPLFKSIMEKSCDRDSYCQWGASFLVLERNTKELFELFLGSASNRKIIFDLSTYLPGPYGTTRLTLKSKMVQDATKRFSWFVMVPAGRCDKPFDLPHPAVIQYELDRFLNAGAPV